MQATDGLGHFIGIGRQRVEHFAGDLCDLLGEQSRAPSRSPDAISDSYDASTA